MRKIAGGLARVEYLVIREVATDTLRVIFVPAGYRPGPSKGFRWGGPFSSIRDAMKAIGRDDEELHEQLYPPLVLPCRKPAPGPAKE